MFFLLYHSYMELYYSNPVFVRLCHTSFLCYRYLYDFRPPSMS